MALEIPQKVYAEMLCQARADAPIEACGILAGTGERVERLYKMKNADESADHFMMEPKEQFGVIKDIRAKGLEMLAIYHSHPASPARPSDEDIRLALMPGVLYVIVSLEALPEPEVKAFCIDDGVVSESPATIVEDE